MGNLPFERNRYNPPQDVTSDEAERMKRQQTIEEAEARRRFEQERDAGRTPDEDDGA
ncbi:MAG TPA: hypothetical protein PLL33_04355 [Paracoccus sp. (in: a-proteobacteria)]|nr:hypothetical protein [Paracoccus sp. (in: a-proteobacteria)]